ncbi:glycosyltransferase [Paenibacillus cisolokensis]|uniref:glycosyltransferase n=1 Tax=Paenibacillus cisolokensis TaxID=1658519 RepID=UPI003D28BAB7
MNIWILTSEYPPDFGGGIGMYVDQVSTMFSEAGHDVTVMVRDSHKNSIENNNRVRVVRFQHMQGDFYSYLGYWTALAYQYAEEVISLIKKDGVKPDIIEIQEYNGIGYYLLMRKWQLDPVLKDIPIVVHLHTPTFELDKVNQGPRYKFPNYWIGHMEKFCMKAADALLSPSVFLKKQVQHVAPNNPIEVIHLPYQLKEYEAGYNREYNSDTFLYFGRTEYRKGVVQMLKAADLVWKQGHKFKLKIIGGDTYFYPKGRNLGELLKEQYRHRIEEGNLIFKDAIPPKDLNPEILKARAVIVPSLYENFPYTCLTSMWLGSPMLVSRSGGQAEMVGEDAKAGLIFDWDVEGDFCEKLVELIQADANRLKEMSKHSHLRIRQLCGTAENVKLREQFYMNVIEKSRSEKKSLFPSLLEGVYEKQYSTQPSNEKNLLSIIIPYYNLGVHLDETMESALNVDYKPTEIVIVNDGSTDKYSLEVLEKYRNRSPHIKVVDIANKGLANARNVGAQYAKGEFIAFLDADDLIEPEFYSRAIALLNQYENVSFVYSWLRYFGNSSNVWPTFNTEFPYFLASNMLAAFVVVRRQDFINFGLNKIAMEYGMEDYEGWISMCAHGCLGISIPEPLVKYRVRSDSMSRQFNRDVVIYLREKLSSFHVKLYQKYGLELFNLIDANGPGYLWDNPTLNYPIVGFGIGNSSNFQDLNTRKYELMRIANSKWGSRLIRLFFKLRLQKLFS